MRLPVAAEITPLRPTRRCSQSNRLQFIRVASSAPTQFLPEQCMSQKALVLIGVAVVLLFIAVWAIPTLVDVNRCRPQIEARLEDQLGRDVSLGAIHLSLLPLGFRVQQLVIAEGPEFQTGRPFAQAQMLYVQPKLLPLFRGDLQIHGLELSRPTVELVRSKQGTWNF